MTAQLLDLGPSDVHVAGGGSPKPAQTPTTLDHLMTEPTDMSISAAKRRSLPRGQFADPSERKYPVDTKARADNAAARLEQQKGSMSAGKYSAIKRRIKAAQRRFGESEKPKKSSMRGRGFTMEFSHPSGANVRVRHMSAADADGVCIMPGFPISLGDE